MKNNVLDFYLLANKLKSVVRTGWSEVKISADRLESVAEHIYGCLVLAIALDSENELGLDMLKVFKIIVVKELEKVSLKELSTRDYPTPKERKEEALNTLERVAGNLVKKDELLALFEEYNNNETREAKFVYQLGKIESDIQAKIYELNGEFTLDNALEDAKYYEEELSSEIIPQMKKASDGWILYDRRYYTDDIFTKLSEDIQNL